MYIMVSQIDQNKPFIKIEINGSMSVLTPSELFKYFQVNYTAINFVSESHRQKLSIQFQRARLFYEESVPISPKIGRSKNIKKISRIPQAGIEVVPDYIFLKPITINSVPQLGLFALRKLSVGTWIGVYSGEIFPMDYPTRSLHAAGIVDRYAKTEMIIDGKDWGNHTRFCNHSYNPNVKREIVFYEGMYHIILYTTHVVKPNQQLLYDYGEAYWQALGIEPFPL